MKKSISSPVMPVILFLLFLIPAVSNASYFLRLKNGGELVTPRYWVEGKLIYFYYGGGIAGIERKEIDRVERYEKETDDYMDTTLENMGKKRLPPVSSITDITEKAQGSETTPEVKGGEEKVNLEDYKNKKDQMTAELDGLLERLREATRIKDKDAKEKTREEIRKISAQIYKLTDEVKEKNKGKLPEGWWGK